MKLADSNVWLALALSSHHFHHVASDWFEVETSAGEIAFCRATQQSFLRLVTTTQVLNLYGLPPLTNEEAWGLYEGFRAHERITFLAEPPGVEEHWKRLAGHNAASPKLWMDAYLAAFAIAGAYKLVTTDSAFTQFDSLDVVVLPSN